MSVDSLAGTPLPPQIVVVERSAIDAFAGAIKETDPAYFSLAAAEAAGFANVPVPPTFVFIAGRRCAFGDVQPTAPPNAMSLEQLIGALRDGREGLILHGGEEFTYHEAICAGDVLSLDGYVESVDTKSGTAAKPGMSVLVVRTDYRKQGSEAIAATTRSTYLFRPKPSGSES